MPDEAERFSVSSAAASSSSFPRFEGHAATNSEATGGVGGSSGREKRDATGEGDQGECRLMIPFLVLRGCEVGT